ncbi:MAG TPA: beta galactosidase jelly roll domain-containing protein [Bacteroidota bacterium]|nr:beta galactosidase jelly roll domain-containing protein [Bacteroidota bacterium]
MTVRTVSLSMLAAFVLVSVAAAEDWRTVVDLRGQWKFEVGNDENRANVSFNDSKWGEIFVPSAWEDEGYPGYDGYAWYRKHFRLPAGSENKTLILRLGCIDDVSKIYLNGNLIGLIGSFPPEFVSAYNTDIVLTIPQYALNVSGDNVLAVCVYDDQLGGGIVQGKIGIYESRDYLAPEYTLAGQWKFKTGDWDRWSDPSFDDSQWNKIFVPAHWESQGYPDYDGVAWYRLHVKVPAALAEKNLILLLGKIDDLDETFLNGEEIGHTGTIRINPKRSSLDGEYNELRAYRVPPGLLKAGRDNVIAVRVYDGRIGGGIYEGPVGFTTRERFAAWTKTQSKKEWQENKTYNFLKWLFE